MQILQVVQEFSTKGGVESVAYELQEVWKNQSVKSTVIAGVAPGSEQRQDVHIVSNPLGRFATRGKIGKYLGRFIVVPSFTIAVHNKIKSIKNQIAKEQGITPVVLSHGDSLMGDAVVIHAVNKASLIEKKKQGKHSWMLNPLHWWVGARDRYMIGGLRYKQYIAISRRIADEIHTLYNVPRNKISIIPNGVNIDKFTPALSGRKRIRAELSIPDSATVLLFVGHEFERKGLMFIVDALYHLTAGYHLIVVGNDNADSYKKLAAEKGFFHRIHFTGPRQDLPEIYRASDVFVFPTAYEAFGLVTMEALASGLPILSTRVGGIEDYLEDGVNGYFITRDKNDIISKIHDVFRDSVHYENMRVAARKTSLYYSWNIVALKYYQLLKNLQQEN